MTPRSANLRVAHQRTCANGTKTAVESAGKGSGCTCKPGPSYYVMWRDRSGATRKSPRVKNRAEAEKLLRAKQVEIDQHRVGTRPQKDIAFADWIVVYGEIMDGRGVRAETRRTYNMTLEIAKQAIGYVNVRDIGAPELRRFYDKIKHTAEATRIKHLTHLNTCLEAAIDDGYADRNPVRAFRKSLRLRAPKGTPPFTDGEVERLLTALRGEADVYVAMVRAMLATGARAGEVIAVDWNDLSLTDGTLKIRHSYNPEDGLTLPKDGDERTVHLTPDAEKVFADWLRTFGGAGAAGIMFPAPRSGSYVSRGYLGGVVNDAMETAGIPTVDERTNRPRKPLHSLRATFARRMLEAGKHPQWVEAQLGHADLALTMHVYGKWSDEAMRKEARGAEAA